MAPGDAPSWRCRQLGADDARRCADLHRISFSKSWSDGEFEGLLASAPVITDGVGASGIVSGFVVSRRASDEAEILTIAVDPASRGRGMAKALLGYHLSRLARAGVSSLFLEVDESNAPALALYWRYGFVKIGQRTGYYARADGRRATALVLRCTV